MSNPGLRALPVLFVLLTLLSAAAPAQTPPLTAETVRTYLEAMESAIHNNDLDAIAASLAPDVMISFKIDSAEGEEYVQFSREEYMATLYALLPTLTDYSFKMTIKDIEIDESGQRAQVTLDIWEKLVWPEHQQESYAREVIVLEQRDGQLVAILITGHVKVDQPILSA